MSMLPASEKTHQIGMLPQSPAMESVSADRKGVSRSRDRQPRVGPKRGTDTAHAVTGRQLGRGERHRVRTRGDRHSRVDHDPTGSAGSDPGTAMGPPRHLHPRVFVVDRHHQPLMPCHPARARELLHKGRARVHKLYPFTIRLVDRLVADSQVDGVQVTIDPGSRRTGIAVSRTDDAGAVHGLVSVQVTHRGQQIHHTMVSRAALRRGRRSRNLRYRAPRFNHRTHPTGWLPPSTRHRVQSTAGWVHRLRRIAPVTGLRMELVRFDLALMVNPEITGVGYQQGTLAGFEVREYLLTKWHRRCAYCDASGVGPGSVALNIDHIKPRARGGTNRVSNLCVACIPCNQAKGAADVREFVTDPVRRAKIASTAQKPLADAAAVNTTRWALHRQLLATGLPVGTGSGGRTKFNRTRCGVPKSHTLDALCVGDITAVAGYPSRVLVARATGRGTYARTVTDKFGFPRLHLTRTKRHHGFTTGDHVRAVVPTGAKAGTHIGRVAVRARGSFNVTTSTGIVRDIHHRHVRLLTRADGWAYTQKGESA
jgi:5-methylcytosine-specific restriction endonuclease McrA